MKKIHELLDRISSYINIYTAMVALSAIVTAFISSYFAKNTDWLNSFGPFAIWFSSLISGLIVVLMVLSLAKIRVLWTTNEAISKWKTEVTGFNPLDSQFNKMRIRLSDVAHPILKRIEDKKFTDCELMGPCNLLIEGANLIDITFTYCDVVVLKEKTSINLGNIVVLLNSSIIGGSVYNTTIYIHPNMVETFKNMNANFLTYTPEEKTSA